MSQSTARAVIIADFTSRRSCGPTQKVREPEGSIKTIFAERVFAAEQPQIGLSARTTAALKLDGDNQFYS